jgi:hypothetical protein
MNQVQVKLENKQIDIWKFDTHRIPEAIDWAGTATIDWEYRVNSNSHGIESIDTFITKVELNIVYDTEAEEDIEFQIIWNNNEPSSEFKVENQLLSNHGQLYIDNLQIDFETKIITIE